MKYISFAIFIILLLTASCKNAPQTPEEKAKKLITGLFETHGNYTYRYKAGPFGKLDSAYSTFHDDSLYRAYRDSVSYYLDKGTLAFTDVADIGYRTDTTTNEREKEKLWKELLAASAKQKANNDSAYYYMTISDSLKEDYKPFFNGWKITHEYEANNVFGIPVSQKTTFYFDVPITRIVGPEEIVEFARNKQ
jgi:hypothetical protein